MIQVLQEGLDCGTEARQVMVYHEVDSVVNTFYGKFKRCHLGNALNDAITSTQMCEFHCSHTATFQHVFLRIMEHTTSGVIIETHLYPDIH